ncbi:WD40-like Beta Propeller Repeat [Catalinimonas alkaloidigena]|uniref:WD40-like Beta Propeller Repeat n=1 Tax=Catalinimonas alkaloidigena TaxID=1075417 RepID=A0A1G9M1Y7_9BACT|nr:hypothetical protein [Catalinimonas alkaloidigena]SDL68226.1 WD40-like Beta Propeller Repeat [Catalinimonas alkaloidigena]
MHVRLRILGLLLGCGLATTAVGQSAQTSFGKNRIQYQQFDWQYLSSNNFNIYYYQDGATLARQATYIAEEEFRRISDLLGFAPYSRIKLFVYSSKADLRQSNVGLDEENSLVGGGQTNLTKSIIEIPFEGNQEAFRREISLGIARTLVREMMYGGSLKDMVQSSYLLSLPDWFAEGAALYAAEGWSLQMDDYMRDLLMEDNLRRLPRLTGETATIAGQSFWNYIAETYGKGSISNILNLTRIIRNEETSIGSTLGVPYDRIESDWESYYRSAAERVEEGHRMPEDSKRQRRSNRRHLDYNDVRISDDGRYMAYSENDRGRFRVIVTDLQNDKRRIVYREGYKVLKQEIDSNLPLLAWKGENELLIISVKSGEIVLRTLDLEKGTSDHRELTSVNQISDVDIASDGRTLVLSADQDGRNDLYLYDWRRGKLTRLTNDLYDDLSPRFLPNSTDLVFSSNRPFAADTATLSEVQLLKKLKNQPAQLFVLRDGQVSPLADEPIFGTQPVPLVGGDLLFLSAQSGIRSLYRYQPAAARTIQLSDFRQNILAYDARGNETLKLAFQMRNDEREYMYYEPSFAAQQEVRTQATNRQSSANVDDPTRTEKGSATTPGAAPTPTDDDQALSPEEIDINHYVFESEKGTTPDEQPEEVAPEPRPTFVEGPAPEVVIRGPYKYTNRLSTDQVVSSFYVDPLRVLGLGILIETGMTDMFENHKIRIGVLPFTNNLLQSSRIYGEYQYLKKRVDFRVKGRREIIYHRLEDDRAYRYALARFDAEASYPFSVASRISGGPLYARTKLSDESGINQIYTPDKNENYAGAQVEYVFDNTLSGGLNILTGTRVRARFEHLWNWQNPNKSFGNFFVDARHYQPLHRNIVLALRGFYGTFTGGSSAKNYLLGGMDNWLFSSTNTTNKADDPLGTPPSGITSTTDRVDWLFNRFATNLRGFSYNTLYGHSVLLFNAELRIPLVRYFYRGPISSAFFRNLQLVAFTDVGSAWTGGSPFNRNNSLNTQRLPLPPENSFEITVINYRNPFLTGYGAGVRTVLLGYFVKFDVAWGMQDYKVLDPKLYLTLGYDF